MFSKIHQCGREDEQNREKVTGRIKRTPFLKNSVKQILHSRVVMRQFQNAKQPQCAQNPQLEILARKMVQIAASVQQLTEELAQSNDRFQSSVDALRRDVTILQEHCHGSGGGSCQ
jgi:phage shock protein A